MRMLFLSVLAGLMGCDECEFSSASLEACGGQEGSPDGKDDPDTDADTDADAGADTGAPWVDSCYLPSESACVEYEGYADTAEWCENMATDYAIPATYSPAPCDTADEEGACAIPAVGDFSHHEATVYYYAPQYDADLAVYACESWGGAPL